MSLSLGPPISPETGERGHILRLTNLTTRSCALHGYPGVSFYSHRTLLPFRVVWGGRYGTGGKPRTVLLHPGARASFLVAKYRCDAGTAATASELRVYPPNTMRQLRLGLRRVSEISYCRGFKRPQPNDPGNTLYVSPVSRASYP
jgi:hypothetical protein